MYGLLFPQIHNSQHETRQTTVCDEKLHIDSPQLGKKKYVQCILYGWNVNFEQTLQVLQFMHNINILNTYCNDVEDYNTKKNRYYRRKFSFY